MSVVTPPSCVLLGPGPTMLGSQGSQVFTVWLFVESEAFWHTDSMHQCKLSTVTVLIELSCTDKVPQGEKDKQDETRNLSRELRRWKHHRNEAESSLLVAQIRYGSAKRKLEELAPEAAAAIEQARTCAALK